MSRRLRGGLARVFPDHRSRLAVAYRREYAALLTGLAIDGDGLVRREAARVALLAVRARTSAHAWAEAVEQRRTGRGRRPNERRIERLARRAALDDGSHVAALDRLRARAGERKPLDLARALMAHANGDGAEDAEP